MDLQHIIDDAKETILKDGEHAPNLYVEGVDGSITLVYFADLPENTRDKQYMMFGLGRKHGTAKLAHLYFVTEAWISVTKGEKPKYDRPSEDPNRKEALCILHLDVQTMKSTMDRAEMLRDGSGQLMDLLMEEGTLEDVHDHLLPYFVAGTASASMSDAELARRLTGQ